MSIDDNELLGRLGLDRGALEAFYRRHVPRVTRFVARRCRSPEDVADVVAATFLVVLERAHTFDARRGEALPWLLGVAHREALRMHRRGARDRALGARIAGATLLSEDDHARIHAQIDAERLAPGLREALAALPPAERELLELVAADGLTAGQVAQVLGITGMAARARLARARRRMRRSAALADPALPPHPQEA
jgi:RNA polymerase sigma factor (sigma-70 family)